MASKCVHNASFEVSAVVCGNLLMRCHGRSLLRYSGNGSPEHQNMDHERCSKASTLSYPWSRKMTCTKLEFCIPRPKFTAAR